MTAPTQNKQSAIEGTNKPAEPVSNPSGSAPNECKECDKRKSSILWWFTFGLLVVAAVWAFVWFTYLQYRETTDDAYSNGNMININSAISGSVVAFFADNTDRVEEGQLLVLLDATEYEVAYEKALADLAATVLDVRQLYDNIEASVADVHNKRALLNKARYDYDNRSQLVNSKAISNQDYIHARDDLLVAELQYKQSKAHLKVAYDAVGNTELEAHPKIEQQKANVRQAYYNLKHCAVYAPSTGYIAQRSVEVGQWVNPTTAMMAVIPTDYVWVDANFKETQLTHMRVGQPAKVWFDMYGSDVVFEGKVLGIGSGSGSVFSLIPPQNATGNWIKIVQRLPVRISLDPEMVKKYPIRLGVSAEVKVHTAQRDLPMLTSTTPTRAVGATKVFDIHLAEVDKIINKVIRTNLNHKKK